MDVSARNIVDVLVSKGVVSPEKYEELKILHSNSGADWEPLLLQGNLASPEDIAKAKGEMSGIVFIELQDVAASPEAISLIPQAVAERYLVVPIGYDSFKNEISVAMANPFDLAALEFLKKKTGSQIKPFIATTEAIKDALSLVYTQSLASEVKEALGGTISASASQSINIPGMDENKKESPITKIVSKILEFAVKSRASDIHIEPQDDKTRVRYRIDGVLHEKLILPKDIHDEVTSRVKILSGMKIDERRIPQDGRFNFKVNGHEVDLRVSSLPVSHGEKIVMRLLRKGATVPGLPELGLRGQALKSFQDAILRPHGIILVCGPTGSGKTTTLYSALSKINVPKVNIVTLEDPVEYEIQGVNQVQINPAAGLTFASGLRSFLRQDPNIIMVGEIRDQETTELAVQASLTGHLVFSTLHTNDASGAIPRLIDLGAEPFLLASAITCIVAQRVGRRICPECKKGHEPSVEILSDFKETLGKLFNAEAKFILYKGAGCDKCGGSGYFGRVGIFEVLPVTEKIGRLILERAPAGTIQKQALEEGMITLKQDGYLKAVEGITSLEEVLRVAQE